MAYQQPLTVIFRAPSPKSALIEKWVAEVGSEADKVATLVPAMDVALDTAMVPAHHKATESPRLLKATEVAAHLLKATEAAALSPK